MKIYNFGNDYAFQRKRKSEEAARGAEKTIVEPVTEIKSDAENKVQKRGGDTTDTARGEESRQSPETRKKKKETGTQDGKQMQENGQVQ